MGMNLIENLIDDLEKNKLIYKTLGEAVVPSEITAGERRVSITLTAYLHYLRWF